MCTVSGVYYTHPSTIDHNVGLQLSNQQASSHNAAAVKNKQQYNQADDTINALKKTCIRATKVEV